MVASVEASHEAYLTSQNIVFGFQVGSILLALGSRLRDLPVADRPGQAQMEELLGQIGAGDFTQRVEVPNKDELGTLAAHLNRMSEELGRLYSELEAANRHKSEFLANMSHELRTPLNAIIGFSEVLQERMFGELNDKQAEYVEDIHASGRHLLSLINDILDLSKVEAGRMELEVARFDLPTDDRERAHPDPRAGQAARHRARDSSLDRRARGVRGRRAQGPADPAEPAVERGEVHARRAGASRYARSPAEAAVEIAVSDTGIGIAPADQEAIFEEFRQVGSDRTRKQEGHRARAHAGEEIRRAARRAHLGRERGGQGLDLHLHPPGAEHGRRADPDRRGQREEPEADAGRAAVQGLSDGRERDRRGGSPPRRRAGAGPHSHGHPAARA